MVETTLVVGICGGRGGEGRALPQPPRDGRWHWRRQALDFWRGGGGGGGRHSTSGGGGGGEGTGWHGLSHSGHIVHVIWSLESTAATVDGVVDASVLTATVVAVDVVDGIAMPKFRTVKNKCSRETFNGSSIIAVVQWRTDQNPLKKKKRAANLERRGKPEDS
ncbi:hypothetical protein NL676_002476 [Syzygium grande]|nr:hypothetical protein NL676_002476 [Syzygium grande]